MLSRVTPPTNRPLSDRPFSRTLVAVLLVGLVAAIGCGGPKEPKDSVSGKVTLKGQPVAGVVVFSVAGKEASGSTQPDGSYKVDNPPLGEAEVFVKGFPGQVNQPVKPPSGAGAVKGGADTLGAGAGMGVPPPAKYGQTNNGLKKLTITGGKQTHDIELTP